MMHIEDGSYLPAGLEDSESIGAGQPDPVSRLIALAPTMDPKLRPLVDVAAEALTGAEDLFSERVSTDAVEAVRGYYRSDTSMAIREFSLFQERGGEERFGHAIGVLKDRVKEEMLLRFTSVDAMESTIEETVEAYASDLRTSEQDVLEYFTKPKQELDDDGTLPQDAASRLDQKARGCFNFWLNDQIDRLEAKVNAPVEKKLGFIALGGQKREVSKMLNELADFVEKASFSFESRLYSFLREEDFISFAALSFALDARDGLAHKLVSNFMFGAHTHLIEHLASMLSEAGAEEKPEFKRQRQEQQSTSGRSRSTRANYVDLAITEDVEKQIVALRNEGLSEKQIKRSLFMKYHPDLNESVDDTYIKYITVRFSRPDGSR